MSSQQSGPGPAAKELQTVKSQPVSGESCKIWGQMDQHVHILSK